MSWKATGKANIEMQQEILVQGSQSLSLPIFSGIISKIFTVNTFHIVNLQSYISWNDCDGLSFQRFSCLEKVCWKYDNYVKKISIKNESISKQKESGI